MDTRSSKFLRINWRDVVEDNEDSDLCLNWKRRKREGEIRLFFDCGIVFRDREMGRNFYRGWSLSKFIFKNIS